MCARRRRHRARRTSPASTCARRRRRRPALHDARQRRLSSPRRSAACTCAPARASPASPPNGMRPVSVAIGKQDRHFKYISGLGEEKYPALLAVPILRGGVTAGVLVLQRGVERAFSDGEVVLATALAAVINHAIERGLERERQQARSSRAPRRCACRGSRSWAAPRWAAPSCCRRCRRCQPARPASRPRRERSRRRSSACRRSCARRRRARATRPRASCAASR